MDEKNENLKNWQSRASPDEKNNENLKKWQSEVSLDEKMKI